MTATLDPEFNRILSQRDAEDVAEYERKHPDFFPAGTTHDQKIKHIRKIQKKQDDVRADKIESFHKLDQMTEAATAERAFIKSREAINARARELYQSSGFVEYCRETFTRTWYGDQHILDAVLLQAAALHVQNISSGINLHIAGKTQSGKSDAVRHALKFLPDTLKYSGTFSRLALYHSKKFHDEMIVFSDDTQFDPDTAAILRGILTAWEEGSERETLVGKEWVTVRVPCRLNMILTSVESVSRESDDGQDESRFLTLNILRDSETEKSIRMFMQAPKTETSGNMEIIREVWSIIPRADVNLHRIIDKDLPFREFARYLSLLKACALLHNRTATTEDDVRFVDQLLSRSRPMLSGDVAGLLQNERVVLDYLKANKGAHTVKEIQKSERMTHNAVYRALRGRTGTLQSPSNGLLMKEPHISITWLDGVREWGIIYE